MGETLRDRLAASLGSAYTVERELGGGGMSQVFLARDCTLNRDVVVKLVPWELNSEAQAERFRREIAIAARLQHPHIVPVLTAGEIEGRPYYTMPFVDGESLGARLRRSGELPIADAIRTLRDVAVALAYAHSHGVVHRDIKPDNVLVTQGVAVVTDFGVAKAASAAAVARGTPGAEGLTPFGAALGTPAYMSPEQAAGDPNVDSRSDIYSLGCLAYEVLSGAPPFAHRSGQATLAAHLTEPPAPLRILRASIPQDLNDLVMRCLEKHPADRPQAAQDIVESLDRIALLLASGHREASERHSPIWASGPGRRATTWLAASAVIAAVVIAAADRLRSDTSPVLDRRVLAVLPVRVAGAHPALREWRERLVYLIEDKMARAHTVRAVDSHALLTAWRRAGGSDTMDLPREAEVELARVLGAGQLLVPSLISNEEEQTIRATMFDVLGDKPPRSAVAKGPRDSIPALVDRVVAELLALGADEEASVASALASENLQALDAYLEGRALYRASRMVEARAAFLEALRHDSAFALAGFYLAQTAWFPANEPAIRARGYDVAWAHRDQLPSPHRLRLFLEVGRNRGQPALGLEGLRAIDTLGRLAPQSAETWAAIGDWLFHWGPAVGVPDPAKRAQEAFARSLRLDSSFAPVLEHLPLLYWEHGDTAATSRALVLERRLDTTDVGRTTSALTFAALVADSAAGARVFNESLSARERETLSWLIMLPAWTGRFLEVADSAARRMVALAITESEQAAALREATRHALYVGRPLAAARLRSQIQNPRGRSRTVIVDMLLREGDTVAARDGIRVLAGLVHDTLAATGTRRIQWARDALILGQGLTAIDDTAGARKVLVALHSATFPADAQWMAAERDRYVLLLSTHLAMRGGSGEARRLVAKLDSTLRSAPNASLVSLDQAEYYGATGTLALARFWDKLGHADSAFAAIRRLPRIPSRQMEGCVLHERARLAALAGDRGEAIRTYRYYVAARANAEPSLQPRIAHARAELARLERMDR